MAINKPWHQKITRDKATKMCLPCNLASHEDVQQDVNHDQADDHYFWCVWSPWPASIGHT